jgi:uncharacterized membrane protein YhhN
MMTSAAWAFAALAVVFALTDWWAVVAERMTVRYVAKPATLAALIGVAVTLDPSVSPAVRAWMVAGLVFSLGGDVFLMLDERWFVAGLASFLIGHISYIVAMQLAHDSWIGLLVGVCAPSGAPLQLLLGARLKQPLPRQSRSAAQVHPRRRGDR